MGGCGSGTWYRWQGSKTTVEDCLSLDVKSCLRQGLIEPGTTKMGGWTWSRGAETVASIGYTITTHDMSIGFLNLRYTSGRGEKSESLDYSVILQTTQPHFGGFRWWFTCPLIRNGRPCRRRVAKLYLGGKYFGCRQCHNLTYRSCQEAHQQERSERFLDSFLYRSGNFDPKTMKTGELLAFCKASSLAGR